MNITHLRAFHAVATHHSFSRAARAVGLRQPTLSEQVRLLEQRYAVRLVERSGRSCELTRAGRELFAITERLFAAESEAEVLLSRTEDLRSGTLRFGTDFPALATSILAVFHTHHPGVALQLTTGSSGSVRERVLRGEIDAGTSADGSAHPELSARTLSEQDLVAFARSDHPQASRKTITLERLVEDALVIREPGSITRRRMEEALGARELTPAEVIEVDSREAVHAAVIAGLGVGVLAEDEFLDDPRLVLLDFEEPLEPITEYLLYRSERSADALVRAVLGSLP